MARQGRLASTPIRVTTTINEDMCASQCLDINSPEICMSFNYDFGESQTCEFLKEIETPTVSLNEVQLNVFQKTYHLYCSFFYSYMKGDVIERAICIVVFINVT